MNLSWLDDFLALATTGNFSRAADDRHMTQPAFGRRIKALEEWLGVELFDRSSQPIRLTEAGQWFGSVAQDLLAQVARVPGQAREVEEAHSSALRFAATHALSFSFMPGWLRSFEAHTMAGTIQLESDVLTRCEALLAQSKVQFVICHAHPQTPNRLQTEGYPSLQIGTDVLLPVSKPASDGQPMHTWVPNQASSVKLLMYSEASGLGQILRQTLRDKHHQTPEKIAAQTVFTAHLASVLRTMVLDGRGLAWLPRSLIDEDVAAGRLVAAADPAWDIDLDIRLYRSCNAMGRTAQGLWDAVARKADAT